MTFGDLAAKWAPGTRSYRRMIEGIAEQFEEFCAKPDPQPGAGPGSARRQTRHGGQGHGGEARAFGWRRVGAAGDRYRQGAKRRKALGAGSAAGCEPAAATSAAPPFRLLNQPAVEARGEVAPAPGAAADDGGGGKLDRGERPAIAAGAAKLAGQSKTDKGNGADKPLQTASAAAAAKSLAAPPATATQKCRVWTASYGGQKAMLISPWSTRW